MELIVRSEPIGTKYLEGYPQIKELLQQVGWLKFMEKFNGFHKEVTKPFARSFNGSEVEIGDIKFIVMESFIAESTECRGKGSIGLKTKNFTMKPRDRC